MLAIVSPSDTDYKIPRHAITFRSRIREGAGPSSATCGAPTGTGNIIVHHAANASNLAQAVTEMKALNDERYNIYFENNFGTASNHRSKAGDITHLRAVGGDADAKGDRSIDRCIEAAAALPLPPTFTNATGGGIQVVYLLHEVVKATRENSDLYTKIGRAVRDMIDGDAVFDLPRMMRMPGFVNHPTAKKLAAGRVAIKAKVLVASGRRYKLAELAEAFALPATPKPAQEYAGLNADLSGGLTTDRWFDRLPAEDKNACLAEMLGVPAVVALANTSDGATEPNWRTIVAACARSGAPNAFELCRAWAQTSTRYSANDFTSRWKSYSDG